MTVVAASAAAAAPADVPDDGGGDDGEVGMATVVRDLQSRVDRRRRLGPSCVPSREAQTWPPRDVLHRRASAIRARQDPQCE